MDSGHRHLFYNDGCTVIDLDLSNFFGEISHRKLVQILELKIKDRVFIRYIVRMLKAGVATVDGEIQKGDKGTPQGSIASPVLANIFAHYALDEWLNGTVRNHVAGPLHFVRYADDGVICVKHEDAPRVMKALESRLARFSLPLNVEKTKMVSFCRRAATKGQKQESFKFLGFSFYLGKSRRGLRIPMLKTAKKTYAAKLKEINEWCKVNRSRLKLRQLWDIFRAKLRGHIQYYGVSFNTRALHRFVHESCGIFFKWMNRRSQKRSITWQNFRSFERAFPLPKISIAHRLC